MFIGHPLGEGSKGVTKGAAVGAKLGEPTPEGVAASAIETTGATKTAGDLDDDIVSDLERHKVGEVTIALECPVVGGFGVRMFGLQKVVDGVAIAGAGGIEERGFLVGCDVGHSFLELPLEHEAVEHFVALLGGGVFTVSSEGGAHVALSLGHEGAVVVLVPGIELVC